MKTPRVVAALLFLFVGASSECEDLIFTLFLDEFPEEVAYTLECDSVMLWDKPFNSYSQEDAFEIMQDTVICLAPRDTCHFTIKDLYGDGLTAAGYDNPGYFALTHGAETVAMYDGSVGRDADFVKLSYCFGPGVCPLDEIDMGADAETLSCEPVHLTLIVDEFPSEVGFKLDCGTEIIWDVPVGTYSADEQFSTFVSDACVESLECCTFVVYDSWGDGLTSPQNNIPGSFELVWDGGPVAFYDGSDSNAEYNELSFTVGPSGCSMK